MSHATLKANWEQVQEHFSQWWALSGFVAATVYPLRSDETPTSRYKSLLMNPVERYNDPERAAEMTDNLLAAHAFPGDSLPLADTDIGPGSLCLFLGCQPVYQVDHATVWFNSPYRSRKDIPVLAFQPENPWWIKTLRLHEALVARGIGKFLTGFPDLVEGWDILASLRGTEKLLIDMTEDPEWVRAKLKELGDVYRSVYDQLYNNIKESDGSSAYSCFHIWSTGKTAKLQCDGSAMFSPAMFDNFVVPTLVDQCSWLDHTLYHLDGTQCLCHLDSILKIPNLKAIEWTPQAGISPGDDPCWYDLYRNILDAGKGVQILVERPDRVPDILNALGTNGVYLLGTMTDEQAIREFHDQAGLFR